MMMCIDSGDASFGAVGAEFFDARREYVEQNGRKDSIRSAGVGGYRVEECYYVADMPVRFAGRTVWPEEFVVKTQSDGTGEDYDARIGLRTMMLMGRLRFNMVDFVVSADVPKLSSMVMTDSHTVPSFRMTRREMGGRSVWQTVGLVGMSIANGLLNHNGPAAPDL